MPSTNTELNPDSAKEKEIVVLKWLGIALAVVILAIVSFFMKEYWGLFMLVCGLGIGAYAGYASRRERA